MPSVLLVLLPTPEQAQWIDQGEENTAARTNMGSWGPGETDTERQPHAGVFINKEAAGIWQNWMEGSMVYKRN